MSEVEQRTNLLKGDDVRSGAKANAHHELAQTLCINGAFI